MYLNNRINFNCPTRTVRKQKLFYIPSFNSNYAQNSFISRSCRYYNENLNHIDVFNCNLNSYKRLITKYIYQSVKMQHVVIKHIILVFIFIVYITYFFSCFSYLMLLYIGEYHFGHCVNFIVNQIVSVIILTVVFLNK